MSIIRKRWLRRSTVGFAAAVALIMTTAGPAAADELPEDTDISGEFVGGFIRVNDVEFPIGGDPDPTDRCTTGDPTILTASVGPADASGVSDITNVLTDFDTTEVAQDPFGGEVCAEIVQTNAPEGTQTQTALGVGIVNLDDPGAIIDVNFSGPLVPAGCAIEGVDIDAVGGLNGPITGTGPTWDLTLSASGFEVPETNKTTCGMLVGGIIDGQLGGLPTTNTEAEFEIEVTEVP